MISRCFIPALLLVVTAGSLGAETASAQTAAPADDRLRTVVMGIAARRGVKDTDLAHALSDVALGVYATDAHRIVIGPEDLRRALDWEASRQQAGCDDSKCLAEVGAALDASRIISGTLDLVGDVYLLSLAEIDAKSLEPIGRVQAEVKKDEAELMKATKRLSVELLAKASSQKSTVAAANFSGSSGSIEFSTDPRGAAILVGGQPVGTTPTRIENVAVGRHTVRITRNDYETVDVDVPVSAGGTTKVDAQLRILRAIAEANLEVRQNKWRDANQWNQIGGWTKGVVGVVVGGAGLAIAGSAFVGGNGGLTDAPVLTGIALAGLGTGLVAWGAVDLLNPPVQPVPEWEMERKVTVTPPKGAGDAEVKMIQEAKTPAALR